MKRLIGFTTLATCALSVAALGAAMPHRVRGTVVSISADSLVVHPATGSDVTVGIGSGTHYLLVEKSDLDHIEKGSYIGTATKGSGAYLVALEVVIFPPAMRGTGDGHYGWDKLPDTTLSGGRKTASTMTNGNVESAAPAGGAKTVSSTMTNGDVQSATDKSGAKKLVVTYKGGKQTIVVPPTAPIVTFAPAEMSAVKPGETVFVNGTEDGGTITAKAVAIGTPGANPPM